MDELSTLTKELFPANLDDNGVMFSNPLEVRSKIIEFERIVCSIPGEQIQIKTTHKFTNGLYCREVFIPKGAIVIGKIHKHPCISIMSMGDKTVLTEDGVRRLRAPFTAVSRPGIKRVGFAHEDSIWTTIHATDEMDLDKLDELLFVKTYDDVKFEDFKDFSAFTMEGFVCQE